MFLNKSNLAFLKAAKDMDSIGKYALADCLTELAFSSNQRFAQNLNPGAVDYNKLINQIYARTSSPEEMQTLNYIFSINPNAIGAPKKALLELWKELHKDGWSQIPDTWVVYISKIATVFGLDWRYWVKKNKVDSIRWILLNWYTGAFPDVTRESGKRLEKVIRNLSINKLSPVFRSWNKLTQAQQSADPNNVYRYALAQEIGELYNLSPEEVTSPEFAEEYSKWDNDMDDDGENSDRRTDLEKEHGFYSDYKSLQNFFEKSKLIPMPNWADVSKRYSFGGYTGRFIPRNDPRGLWLGQHTDCCQHPSGAGSSIACHCAINPQAAFFVVEDKKGEIIAQSATWLNEEESLIIFDSIELLGAGEEGGIRKDLVKEIYHQASMDIERFGWGVAVGGTGKGIFGPAMANYRNTRPPFYSDAMGERSYISNGDELDMASTALEAFREGEMEEARNYMNYEALRDPAFAKYALENRWVSFRDLPVVSQQSVRKSLEEKEIIQPRLFAMPEE